jgi:hypothetical protein
MRGDNNNSNNFINAHKPFDSFLRRYTTAHLNDPSTSKTVRALLMET